MFLKKSLWIVYILLSACTLSQAAGSISLSDGTFLSPADSSAKTKKRTKSLAWGSFGVGLDFQKISTYDGNIGFNYQFHFKRIPFQVGGCLSKEWTGSYFPLTYDRYYQQVHTSIGYVTSNGKIIQSVFVGPAVVVGEFDRTNFEGTRYSAVGIQGNASIVYMLLKDIGVGLEIFGCYNVRYTNGGLRIVAVLSNTHKAKKQAWWRSLE